MYIYIYYIYIYPITITTATTTTTTTTTTTAAAAVATTGDSGGDWGGGGIFPEHQGPILHAPRVHIARRGNPSFQYDHIHRSGGFALTGYVIPGCVEDGAWMLWENYSAVVAADDVCIAVYVSASRSCFACISPLECSSQRGKVGGGEGNFFVGLGWHPRYWTSCAELTIRHPGS